VALAVGDSSGVALGHTQGELVTMAVAVALGPPVAVAPGLLLALMVALAVGDSSGVALGHTQGELVTMAVAVALGPPDVVSMFTFSWVCPPRFRFWCVVFES
jgi:hypothetical protein